MWQWLRRLVSRAPRVEIVGKGYRVNGAWCESQVAVRRRLEQLGLTEREVLEILRDLNAAKYGDPQR